ncbi:uncharacterized protein LOC112538645 [Tetranychus urticae]|uniref:uncharacterized protein LOC112538645 n=1 Tax=Tetranychus urticae TaxID=32264 RepID=UPI000D6523B8|nr:uncharacterized protein LOC112538645 [Tetranychus urticae]
MLINELPDDCLLAILDYIQDFEDLINCFKVCEKWSNLIADRTKKVKYFIGRPKYLPDSVSQQSNKPIDVAFLSKWFPNLRFIEFSRPFFEKTRKKNNVELSTDAPIDADDLARAFQNIMADLKSNLNLSLAQEKSPIEKLLSDSESLKGIICGEYFNFKSIQFEPQKANLEMLTLGYINPNRIVSNETVKQLNLWDSTLDAFKKVAHYFPNLERLKISNSKNKTDFYFNGPVMQNLKIVELSGSSRRSHYIFCNSFVFMDSCPALQSAHIKIERGPIATIYSVKNANLQDLVIQLVNQPNYLPDSVCHQTDEPIDVTFLSKWLPNLRFADLLYTRNGETPIEDIIKLIRDSESLKGIIYGHHYCMESCLDFESIPENPNLEMLSTGYIDINIREINENMKQLYLWDSTIDLFEEVAHHLPNLERLKIYNGEGNFI